MRSRKSWLMTAALTTMVISLVAGSAPATSVDADGVELVAEVPVRLGTHLEFLRRDVDEAPHVFALIGSRDRSTAATNGSWDAPGGGLNIIDITDPRNPFFVANVPCRTDNVDIAVLEFPEGISVASARGRDGIVPSTPYVYDTLIALGSNDQNVGCSIKYGTGNTVKGTSVSFVGILKDARLVPGQDVVHFLGRPGDGVVLPYATKFAHTVVSHPTRPVIYSGNQNLADRSPTVEIIDFSGGTWPPAVKAVPLIHAGSGPHDITFSPDGERAYFSSITESYIYDTSGAKLLSPELIAPMAAPGLKIHHEAILHPNGRHVLVVDEFVASSESTTQCPGGGVHVFDLGDTSAEPHGALEKTPAMVGAIFANDASNTTVDLFDPDDPQNSVLRSLAGGCTAHEYTIAPSGSWMPIAWFGGGVRVFDLTDLNAAASLPAPRPVVVPEIAHYKKLGDSYWAAKVIAEFPRFIFASDEFTGFKVFEVTADLPS